MGEGQVCDTSTLLFLLFVLARMTIIHQGSTPLGKRSWKEITKKYREGIWLSFGSQRNYTQNRKQCDELSVTEHFHSHHGCKGCVGCWGVSASSGREHLRARNGPKSLKGQRHQQPARPAWHYHGQQSVCLVFEHKPSAQGLQ